MKTTIRIPKTEAKQLQTLLSGNFPCENSGDIIQTFTGKFENGFEVDIKVCNCDDRSGAPWIDAVLFDNNGCEIMCLDVRDTLLGEYIFDMLHDHGTDVFVVDVVATV